VSLWNDLTVTPLRTIRVGEAGAIEINEDPDAFDNVWLSVSSGTSVILYGVAWNGTRAVAVGAAGVIIASDDQGLTWYAVTSGITTDLYALDVGDNVFVAVGALGVIRTSQTGLSWEPVDSGTFWNLWDVTVLNAEYTAVGDNDVIVVGSLVSTLLDIVVSESIATAEDSNSQGILNSSADDDLVFDEAVSRATYAPMPVLVAVTEHMGMEDSGETDVGGVVETGFDETSSSLDVVVTEQLMLDDVDAWRYQGDMAELFFIFLDDAMALSSVQSTDQMVANSDAVDSFSLHDRPFLNNDTLVEAFALSTTLTGAYGKAVLEDIGLNDALAALSAFSHLVTDSFAMDDVPSPVGTMLITVGETVLLDDTLSISQIINGLINEGISFSVALTLDGETYLAWVMNTETYGVTNYENFRFNSMCGFNGVYYATDGTKIYRLDGQTDDGTAIDAEISLGASDFGSAFLKRMERAYLGLRADGQMVLKVITDEKAEDWYTLESVPSALGESHVKIGKGLKARYWRLALRNKGGSDFTLDSLRLLPLKLSRRV
jgi:hypothetical protein